jgi:hypothetical protein
MERSLGHVIVLLPVIPRAHPSSVAPSSAASTYPSPSMLARGPARVFAQVAGQLLVRVHLLRLWEHLVKVLDEILVVVVGRLLAGRCFRVGLPLTRLCETARH